MKLNLFQNSKVTGNSEKKTLLLATILCILFNSEFYVSPDSPQSHWAKHSFTLETSRGRAPSSGVLGAGLRRSPSVGSGQRMEREPSPLRIVRHPSFSSLSAGRAASPLFYCGRKEVWRSCLSKATSQGAEVRVFRSFMPRVWCVVLGPPRILQASARSQRGSREALSC